MSAAEEHKHAVRLLMDQGLPPGSHRSPSLLGDHGVDSEAFDTGVALGAFSRDLLKDDPELRLEAATALAWMLDDRATSPLLRALCDIEWDVRLAAAEGLAMLSPVPEWAFEPLSQRASDPEAAVRAAIMTALANNECVDALPLLASGISDRDRAVAVAAVDGLQHLGRLGITSSDAAVTISRRLAQEPDPYVGYALYWALAWQGGKKFELKRSEWRYSPVGDLACRIVPGAP